MHRSPKREETRRVTKLMWELAKIAVAKIGSQHYKATRKEIISYYRCGALLKC